MSTNWSTTEDYEFAEQNLWKSKIISSTSEVDFKIASEAPEDIHLTFEELDIAPEQIQGDNFYEVEWTRIDQASAVGLGGWNIIFSGVTETD